MLGRAGVGKRIMQVMFSLVKKYAPCEKYESYFIPVWGERGLFPLVK